MSPQTLFIEANTGIVSTSLTTATAPNLRIILGSRLTLNVAFHVAGVIGPIADYTADTLRLAVKKADDLDSPISLLPLGTWSASGSGTATRYKLIVRADSEQLQAAIGDLPELTTRAQITWDISTQDEPRLSFPFDLTIVNSPARSNDGEPDTEGAAAYAWLLARLLAGTGITLTGNSGTQQITIATASSFGRVTTDISTNGTSWANVFSIPVLANSTYRLEMNLIATVPDSRYMRVVGDLISGATAHGLWDTLDSGGTYSVPPYAFNAGSGDELVTNQSGSTQTFVAKPQSFILVTTSTAGNIVIKARTGFEDSAGTIKAGSHYVLTKLA